MPDLSHRLQVDLEDLPLNGGGSVLLRRALVQLRDGEQFEVRGDSEELRDQLRVWCRQQGCECTVRPGSPARYSLRKVARPPALLVFSRKVAEVADPAWGLAPRGAGIEPGGPDFGFTLRQKRDVWARELKAIYHQAAAGQWSAARDVPWKDLPRLPAEVEAAVAQLMTFLTENEFAALYVPARFISRIHPHYREVVEVLAIQVADEARHAEVFTRRAEAGGLGLGMTAVSGQLSLKTLLEEPDFTTAAFLLCVMGEGTFLTLLKFLADFAPDPVTAALARLAHRDEARHLAFGTEHLRYVFEREPNLRYSLAAAAERRSRMLASISGLTPWVHDALVVYSGGGAGVPEVRRGAAQVANLLREMDRSRRERLQALGFAPELAAAISSYHTKNFM